ncbi:MAG: FAD-binding protein, partial [Desulfuromonadales bacterium]|nr:FAD-binding protein [Desulfuromonadales bacterium]
MLRLRDITLTLEEDESILPGKIAAELEMDAGLLRELRVVRRGIDARRKSRILRIFTVEFTLPDEAALLARHRHPRLEAVAEPSLPTPTRLQPGCRALVVGMGPAGLFAALDLAGRGVAVTLIEQGSPVQERVADVRRFWSGGRLDVDSNVQFGEGGAGTFSDGKLTTRLNHPWTRLVLQTLVDCGAPDDILVQAKPHIGTDRLRLVLIRFRQRLQHSGVDIRFHTRLTGLAVAGG